MKVTAVVITNLAVSIATTQAANVQTLPITIPKNQYFVTSNLITAIEYLHRAFPTHPSIYIQDGNFVYNHVDPTSGNLTDLVEPSDLYLNAKNFNDVLVGIETVMYNQVPNPDTDPVSPYVISNMKLSTNYITNIASYCFSTSDQGYIASFYNFTATRYNNLFSRENSTALIPFNPISFTNNTNKTITPTPLLYNISIFDDLDGKTFNNTLSIDPNVLASNVMNSMATTLQLLGIQVIVTNGTNTTTTTTTTSASITPATSATQHTSAEPSVTDTNDPGNCGFDCSRLRNDRRRFNMKYPRADTPGAAITISPRPPGSSSGAVEPPKSVTEVTSQITFSQGGSTIAQGLSGSEAHQSLRSRFVSAARKAVAGSQAIARAAKSTLQRGIGTAMKQGMSEALKGTADKASALARNTLERAAGGVASELVEQLGDAAQSSVDKVLEGSERGAIINGMTSFFGFSESVATAAVEAVFANPESSSETTFGKTKLAISEATRSSPEATRSSPGSYPDFESGSVEDWVGRSLDRVLAKKYPGKNINRNSRIGSADTLKTEAFPAAEIDAFRSLVGGVTDKVASSSDFKEETYMGGLSADKPEETFGYQITASREIDESVSGIAAVATENAATTEDNAGFISDAVTASGSQDAFTSKLKNSVLGKRMLKSLGKNFMRARSSEPSGEMNMDAKAQSIYNALGEKAFSGLTKNVRNGLKSTAARAATAKTLVRNAVRSIFRNFSPKR
ncbi:hypothetical protein HDU76_013144 [Blyttiomyces sp. JEL0837]|nr:hypothetical protein HDU76_013144 [Blyttiomyces sp. JEL0837]